MPESRGKNLSAESIDALLLALGLSDGQGPGRDVEPKSMAPINAANRISSPARKSSLAAFPRPAAPHSHLVPSDMDEAQIFGRDYLSDFDIYSDLGEDSDLELGTILALAMTYVLNRITPADTLPPRPGSSLDSFEMVDSDQTERYSVSSDSTFVPPDIFEKAPDPIYLKVAHQSSIVMLRAPWNITFMDLKRRLYDKFVNQQGIFLSHTFSVVLAVRPGSLDSPLPSPIFERGPFAERTEMHLIRRESEWRTIVSMNDGSKITLRILDTPSSS